MTGEQTPPVYDDRRRKAPPSHPPAEDEGPSGTAGARYAIGNRLRAAGGSRVAAHLESAGPSAVLTGVAIESSADAGREGPSNRNYRIRVGRPRLHRVNLRLQQDEYEALEEAARGAGLTLTGYAAAAAMAAALRREAPTQLPLRRALLEIIAARGQVRRFGVNVNQAVRVLNSVGEPPPWLPEAVELTTRAVARLDDAADALVSAVRRGR
jgi:Protein of unknown function (DUF1778)